MELGLKGKVAVVRGAGRGIGREIALGLAREGAQAYGTSVAWGYLCGLDALPG